MAHLSRCGKREGPSLAIYELVNSRIVEREELTIFNLQSNQIGL